MRTQNENPLYIAYQKLVPFGTRYPAEFVNIFWNVDEQGRVYDLEIVFVPRGGIIKRNAAGMLLWEQFSNYISRWSGDLGNSCDGWMQQPDGLTPAQVFGHLLRLCFSGHRTI
jgi:hypothetical protein